MSKCIKYFKKLLFINIAGIIFLGCAGINNYLRDEDCSGKFDSLTAFEKEVFNEINLARTNPGLYSKFIRERNVISEDYTEAVEFLKSRNNIPPVMLSGCLCLAARDLVYDNGPRGILGHVDINGSGPRERIIKYSKADRNFIGEVAAYGSRTPRDVVIDLIVDKDVPGRGHRGIIFDSNFVYAGVSHGYHAEYDNMCVIDFSS